jgi:hypothetical protein
MFNNRSQDYFEDVPRDRLGFRTANNVPHITPVAILKQQLYAGETWGWTESVSTYSQTEPRTIIAYPSSTWNLNIILKLGANPAVNLCVTPNADNIQFDISLNDTKNIPNGKYIFIYKITQPNIVKNIYSGEINIFPNLSLEGVDPRKQWERIYNNLMAKYEKLSTREVTEVTMLNGKHIKYEERAELLRDIKNAAIHAGIEKAFKKVLVRFNDTQSCIY